MQWPFISRSNMSIQFLQQKLFAFVQPAEDAQSAGQLNDGAGPAIGIQILRQKCRSVIALRLPFDPGSVSGASALEQCQSVVGRSLVGQRVAPPSWSGYTVNLGQRRVNVGDKFQNLRRNDGVEIRVRERKLRGVSMMKRDRWPISAMRPSHGKQRLTNVHAMDYPCRSDGVRDCSCYETWPGADVQHPLAWRAV